MVRPETTPKEASVTFRDMIKKPTIYEFSKDLLTTI